ncbi:amylo-alpha-1,6-glucosidase [Streptomyces albus]|uniref:Amylo-alpha-1,6-glucosidase n=1 Tax=Streptomyces albus (strain ATCC 21838 / DSM 41398 / FERM P-419 / JCM 4703 / NBRC 107858) TaxID=1081613 RepID=A0A0B5EQF8_STRA4|nr:amylo-alpha-1,6-glucosidase [Streptomyces albus]AOU75850.1 amylo-alpha-1,6-glucosidase [Streptomyces albus]AYN31656.1 aminotransferase [Streptomyces albus]
MKAPHLLLHAGSFALTDPAGDISAERTTSPQGLIARDTRHLSTWTLTVDGEQPTVLVPVRETDEDSAAVLTAPSTRDEPPGWTLFRHQNLCHGRLVERLRFTANTGEALMLNLRLDADADFADQFELRGDHSYEKPGGHRTVEEAAEGTAFHYRRADWHASTTITAEPPPAVSTAAGGTRTSLTWTVMLPPHGSTTLVLHALTHSRGARTSPPPPAASTGSKAELQTASAPATEIPLHTPAEHTALAPACHQGLADLTALRIPAEGPEGETVAPPAAGVPWFLTLFGRDSLLTSSFALPYRPELAAATLKALAATQATTTDSARVAQPGKILHEMRHGELAHFRQIPYGRYYGSVDSTPLFLVLLHAHAEQTQDDSLSRHLEPHARAAVHWMFAYGGLDQHGYLTYRADERGLVNQNWKDSEDAVCFTDGSRPVGDIAIAEAQGYAYDALLRTACLARKVWNAPDWAAELEAFAQQLRERFTAQFWMPDQAFPALALDSEGRQVDTLASNAGHLLWSGILDPDRGRATGRRLLESDFFSGWGIRTLASQQRPYHPLSYHRGSIWPHDNALIALGLARYGLHREAATLATALAEAAARYDHRLPEVLAGYPRREGEGPIPYPHACSPQAWAAATPLALLTAVRRATEPRSSTP